MKIGAGSRLAVLALFVALTAAHTWPLASAPARLSRNDNADAILNQWILSWVVHQATHDPAHLFDGNIFYPDRGTLAYSEPLLTLAATSAPLFWLGAAPVLVHNVLLFAGLTLTAWATCLLVTRWTNDLAAGVVAGVIAAFNAHTLTRLPQLQGLHMEFLPLALLAFDALLVAPDRRSALWLALWVVLGGLTSFYTVMLILTALGAGALVRLREWTAGRSRRALALLALAGVVAIAALLPAYLPYTRLGQVRTLDEVALYSVTWRQYLSSPARLHDYLWSAPFGGPSLFPGVAAIVLTIAAVASGTAVRDRRARMALAFGVAGVALSLGPALPGYALLYRLFPPLQGIRNAARFGYLAVLAAAILAGFGVATLKSRRRGAAWDTAIVAAIFVIANVDAWSAPLTFADAERISPLHARLRGTSAIVAEFPFFAADRTFHNAPYMLHATKHWRPMLNGYSGLTPPSYEAHALDLARFPDPHAIGTLRAIGVTHIFVHDQLLRDWTDNETADAVRHTPGLKLIAFDGDVALYEVVKTADGPS
jgi:hypothetical protein